MRMTYNCILYVYFKKMPTPDSKKSTIIITFSPELDRQANSKYRNFILEICYPEEFP